MIDQNQLRIYYHYIKQSKTNLLVLGPLGCRIHAVLFSKIIKRECFTNDDDWTADLSEGPSLSLYLPLSQEAMPNQVFKHPSLGLLPTLVAL
jgi:hypothetical protein